MSAGLAAPAFGRLEPMLYTILRDGYSLRQCGRLAENLDDALERARQILAATGA